MLAWNSLYNLTISIRIEIEKSGTSSMSHDIYHTGLYFDRKVGLELGITFSKRSHRLFVAILEIGVEEYNIYGFASGLV
jgi:hypothetical protein